MSDLANLQGAMDEAFAKWDELKEMKGEYVPYDTLLDVLPARLRRAIVLGTMNYQVENGGWVQWIDNGYGKYDNAPHVRDAMTEVLNFARLEGRSDWDVCADRVKFLVDGAISGARAYDEAKQNSYVDEWEVLWDDVDSLSGHYYEVNKLWLEIVDQYFAAKEVA